MRALIMAAVFALAASCAFAQDAGTTTPHRAILNGDIVEAVQGGKFMLQLGLNPATGERWDVTQKPDFLGTALIVETPAPQNPQMRMATISFDVTGAGTGQVVLEMHGPHPNAAALATFRVTVHAHQP